MRRFDEEFVTLSSTELRHCLDQTDLDGEWPDRYSRAILPYSLINENLLNGYLRAAAVDQGACDARHAATVRSADRRRGSQRPKQRALTSTKD